MNSELSLDFGDITPIIVPVTISGEQYELREANGNVACQYRNALLKCTQLGPEGKPHKIDGMADVEPLLVSLCMYDSGNHPVPITKVRSWPSRIVKELFNTAKKISQIDEEETVASLEKEKAAVEKRLDKLREGNDPNLPSDTTAGSA